MCRPPKPFLMVTIPSGAVSENVTKAQLSHTVNAGIRWGALGADMVPIFEEQSARLEKNYTLETWGALDPMEKAILIAQRRINISIQNLQAEAEMRAAKRNQRK